MQKIEYGDINKFFVSVGLVLIGVGILTPYLYLKEDFGLYISEEEFRALQSTSRRLLSEKQTTVDVISSVIFWIPIGLLVLGFSSIIYGLVRWFKRQRKIDERFDKETDKLDLEIKKLTPEEIDEKVKEEVKEIEFDKLITTDIGLPIFTKYKSVEDAIIEQFSNYDSKNFDILSKVQIGERYKLDIILKAKTSGYADRIVEIKYFQDKVSLRMIEETLSKLNSYVNLYKNSISSTVVPVLIFAYKMENYGLIGVKETEAAVHFRKAKYPNLKRLKFDLINENEIDRINVRKYLAR